MIATRTMGMPLPERIAPITAPFRDERATQIANGNREAILELYNEHHAHVRAFAVRLLGCRASAEDLVQEVFLSLPRAFVSFRGECPVRHYLVAIAARRARQHMRQAERRRAAEARAAREDDAIAAGPIEQTEDAELARRLSSALETLPLEQRIAFVLCEVEERTSVEVAAMLDERDGTIRARVALAKKKLRAVLSGEPR